MTIDNRTWDYKYKPKTFNELIYPSKDIMVHLKQIEKDEMVAGNLLFVGPAGSGKTSTSDVITKFFVSGVHDLFSFQDYKKDSIDQFEIWLRNVGNSTKRIAKMEEFERNPNTMPNGSILRLKNGLLENYQSKVSCIATSNNIAGFEEAIKRRFVILDFNVDIDEFNREELTRKLKFILTEEKIEFTDDDVNAHINEYTQFTPAQIIKDMEVKCVSGKLDVSISVAETVDANNQMVIDTFQKLNKSLQNMTKLDLVKIYKGRMKIPSDLRKLQEYLTGNKDVNYSLIYDKLHVLKDLPLPIYHSITEWHENDRDKIYHDQHFINLLFRCIKIHGQLNENVKKQETK